MPNAVLKIVDSGTPLSLRGALQSLSEVPFVQHQYRWLVGELRNHPPAQSSMLLAGYCAARRMSAYRQSRMIEFCQLIAGMTETEVASLPEKIHPSLPSNGTTKLASAPRRGILNKPKGSPANEHDRKAGQAP